MADAPGAVIVVVVAVGGGRKAVARQLQVALPGRYSARKQRIPLGK